MDSQPYLHPMRQAPRTWQTSSWASPKPYAKQEDAEHEVPFVTDFPDLDDLFDGDITVEGHSSGSSSLQQQSQSQPQNYPRRDSLMADQYPSISIETPSPIEESACQQSKRPSTDSRRKFFTHHHHGSSKGSQMSLKPFSSHSHDTISHPNLHNSLLSAPATSFTNFRNLSKGQLRDSVDDDGTHDAVVQAARQQFEDHEAAKARKREKREMEMQWLEMKHEKDVSEETKHSDYCFCNAFKGFFGGRDDSDEDSMQSRSGRWSAKDKWAHVSTWSRMQILKLERRLWHSGERD